jgi:hypothetical protein
VHLKIVTFARRIENYQPREMTIEEFETLTALTSRLFASNRIAALFDTFLHESKRSLQTPLDIKSIRAGLQLLNFDALRLCNRPFSKLSIYLQEALLAIIQSERDAHWPQLPAGIWYAEISRLAAELFQLAPELFADSQRTA